MTFKKRSFAQLVLASTIAAFAAACGDDATPTAVVPTPAPTTAPTAAPSVTPTATPTVEPTPPPTGTVVLRFTPNDVATGGSTITDAIAEAAVTASAIIVEVDGNPDGNSNVFGYSENIRIDTTVPVTIRGTKGLQQGAIFLGSSAPFSISGNADVTLQNITIVNDTSDEVNEFCIDAAGASSITLQGVDCFLVPVTPSPKAHIGVRMGNPTGSTLTVGGSSFYNVNGGPNSALINVTSGSTTITSTGGNSFTLGTIAGAAVPAPVLAPFGALGGGPAPLASAVFNFEAPSVIAPGGLTLTRTDAFQVVGANFFVKAGSSSVVSDNTRIAILNSVNNNGPVAATVLPPFVVALPALNANTHGLAINDSDSNIFTTTAAALAASTSNSPTITVGFGGSLNGVQAINPNATKTVSVNVTNATVQGIGNTPVKLQGAVNVTAAGGRLNNFNFLTSGVNLAAPGAQLTNSVATSGGNTAAVTVTGVTTAATISNNTINYNGAAGAGISVTSSQPLGTFIRNNVFNTNAAGAGQGAITDAQTAANGSNTPFAPGSITGNTFNVAGTLAFTSNTHFVYINTAADLAPALAGGLNGEGTIIVAFRPGAGNDANRIFPTPVAPNALVAGTANKTFCGRVEAIDVDAAPYAQLRNFRDTAAGGTFTTAAAAADATADALCGQIGFGDATFTQVGVMFR